MIEPSQKYFDININYPYQSNETYDRSQHSTDEKGRLILHFFNEYGVTVCREIHENIRLVDETIPQTSGAILQEHLDSEGRKDGLERLWSDPMTLAEECQWEHGKPIKYVNHQSGLQIDYANGTKEYYSNGVWTPYIGGWLAENGLDVLGHAACGRFAKAFDILLHGKKKFDVPAL